MKGAAAVCLLLVVSVLAEPPVNNRYLPPSQRSNDYRTTQQESFAPPSQSYGPPSQNYGPPQLGSSRQTEALVRNGNGFGGRSQPSPQYGAPARFTQNRSPSQQYGAPRNSPSSQYGAPSQFRSAPSSQYGAPSRNSQFNAPSSQYGGPSLSNAPSAQYNAPSSQYNSPSAQYNAPSSQYNAPSSQYNAPSSQYNTPSSQYNAPSSQFNAPASQYNAPSSQYNAPSSQYGAPARSNAFGAPAGQYSTPSEQYGPPSNQYLPPSGRNSDGYNDANSEPANYSFEYMVQDDASGNDFGHREARQGDRAEGLYYVVLPDGRKQTVEYEADESGYKPRISYEDTGRGQGGYDSNSQDRAAYRDQSGGPY